MLGFGGLGTELLGDGGSKVGIVAQRLGDFGQGVEGFRGGTDQRLDTLVDLRWRHHFAFIGLVAQLAVDHAQGVGDGLA